MASRPAAVKATPDVPRVEWSRFDALQSRISRQGNHKLFVGPTGCGKTILARYMARHRKFVVVLGTKPRDESLDGYVDEGYVRVDQWPPRSEIEVSRNGAKVKRRSYRMEPDETGSVRLLLWPNIRSREDLRRLRPVYAEFFDKAFTEGGWTIVIDEAMWVARRSGLGLDQQLADLAFTGRSSNVSLYLCMQRPRNMEKVTWSSVSDAYIFHTGVVDDVRELASLGTNDPREAVQVIQKDLTGHQFLALPCRGQSEGWMISEVDTRS